MSKFAGRYEIIEKIGRGGMGVVYKATDTLLDKIVALKVLTEKVSDQAALRFHAEAKAAGKLNHPNIVMILDFGITEEGEPYMVQEYVEGTTLTDLLQPDGLELEHALEVFEQVCSGLAKAHDSGIIHRDIKPSNVIVTNKDGQPVAKLADFGIAKLIEADQGLTSTGAMVGSPLYMSPEQTRGETIDVRSDIYSLGCLMYETVSGRPPLKGESSMETAQMCMSVKPPPLSTVAEEKISPDLDALVAKCLEKEPSQRYQTVNELAEALHKLPAPEPEAEAVITESVPATERNRRSRSRINQVAVAITVVSLVALGVLYAFSVIKPHDQSAKTKHKVQDPSSLAIVAPMVDELAIKHNTDVPEDTIQPTNESEIRIVNPTPNVLNKLAGLYPKLNCLELNSGTAFDGTNLKALASLSQLGYLKLIALPLKDSAMGELASLKQLTRLKFDFITTLDGSGLNGLSQMNLNEITFSYGMLNKTITSKIAKTKAVIISFKGSNGLTAASVAPLRNMPSLRTLALEHTNLVDSTLVPLKGIRLNVFRLGGNDRLTAKSFEVIRTIKDLKEVGLNGCASISIEDCYRLGNELNLVYEPNAGHIFEKTDKSSGR